MQPNEQGVVPIETKADLSPPGGAPEKRKMHRTEVVGLVLVVVSTVLLLVSPDVISGLFDATVDQIFPVAIDIFLTGKVGIAVIASVIVGRVLERCGFTDALVRIFTPILGWMKINPTVVIPSVYNILGDINAAGKIAGPILKAARATKAEQKIAVATMVQSQQSFATFMLGLIVLANAGIQAFPVVIVSIFMPLVAVPYLLAKTIYRDTRAVKINDLPRFTPDTPLVKTFFQSAREGTELLFLVIIPALAVVFAAIGVLTYIGVWPFVEKALSSVLLALSIDPQSGMMSLLASPTLAMAELAKTAASVDPNLVIGSFILASSGLPISIVFGQVPVIWAENSDLSEREAMGAAVVGICLRLLTCLLLGYLLSSWVV